MMDGLLAFIRGEAPQSKQPCVPAVTASIVAEKVIAEENPFPPSASLIILPKPHRHLATGAPSFTLPTSECFPFIEKVTCAGFRLGIPVAVTVRKIGGGQSEIGFHFRAMVMDDADDRLRIAITAAWNEVDGDEGE